MIKTSPFLLALFCTFLIVTAPLSYSYATEASTPNPLAKEKTFKEKYFSWFFHEKPLEGPQPTETLEAPFKNKAPLKGNSDLVRIYDKAQKKSAENYISNLSIPHRTHGEIQEWLAEAVGYSLNFDRSTMKDFGRIIEPYYNDQGLNKFRTFLIDLNVMGMMHTHDKKVSSYISEIPALKNETAIDGVYKWFFEVPVFITYEDDSKPPKQIDAISREYVMSITISRTPNMRDYTEGLYIENWSGRRLRRKKSIVN